MKKQYVYIITYNGEVMYVGKTCNMKNRKSLHRNQRGTHNSAIPVDADLSKIEFNVVAEFDNEEEALKYEDQLILQYNTLDGGWNKQRSGLVYSDREYVRAQKQDYMRAHREERAAYYEANRERILTQKAAYNKANREYICARQREYDAAHREERVAYQRDYRAAHREEMKAYKRDYMRAYRAHKKAEGVKKVS